MKRKLCLYKKKFFFFCIVCTFRFLIPIFVLCIAATLLEFIFWFAFCFAAAVCGMLLTPFIIIVAKYHLWWYCIGGVWIVYIFKNIDIVTDTFGENTEYRKCISKNVLVPMHLYLFPLSLE